MGYERLWVLRDQFGCKFQIGRCPNLWGIGSYGLREVWVIRVLTVIPIKYWRSVAQRCTSDLNHDMSRPASIYKRDVGKSPDRMNEWKN